jgi:ATP-dependent Lhr-like helicase
VVCTSSLDLGVDFQKVEQVVQIGSAKSLARLVQRAGRSHHRPGEPSRLIFVPTNSWELIELEAARRALSEAVVEPRFGLSKPFDVLVQHLVTLACGEGFTDAVVDEIREASAYQTLTDDEFRWCVEFVRSGGATLQAYPQYKKIYRDHHEIYRIRNSMMARQHRMSIGTITGNQLISLHLANQKRVGSIEETFVAKLKRGDVFYFSGRKLEFMFMRDVKAYCRPTTKKSDSIPSWAGTQFPLSESLSSFFRAEVAGESASQAQELLDAQARISRRPRADELLIEEWDSREGRHLFIYPFGGRSVHEGLAALWTYRLGLKQKSTFTFSVNDYGLMIQGPKKFPFRELIDASLFSDEGLDDQIAATLNLTEMSQRQFRGIAQTAGLVFTGYPTARKTGRQVQVSSGLLFDVFNKHDPGNILLVQARREVLEQQLEIDRLRRILHQLRELKVGWVTTVRPSPLAVPIWAEMNSARLSTESMAERMARMKDEWAAWD